MSWEDRSESLILRTHIERQIWRDAIPVPLGRESSWRQTQKLQNVLTWCIQSNSQKAQETPCLRTRWKERTDS